MHASPLLFVALVACSPDPHPLVAPARAQLLAAEERVLIEPVQVIGSTTDVLGAARSQDQILILGSTGFAFLTDLDGTPRTEPT